MAKKCLIEFPRTNIFDKIDSTIGSNDVLKYAIKLECTKNANEFSDKFIDWFKTNYNTTDNPNFNETNAEAINNIASAISAYYYSIHPNINNTVNKNILNNENDDLEYSSSLERENGKLHVGNILLDEFNRLNSEGEDIKGNKLYHYLNVARKEWLKILFKEAIKINNNYASINDINKAYNESENKFNFINDLFGDNKSITAQNLVAVYDELFASELGNDKQSIKKSIDYITSVLYNPKYADILRSTKKDLEDESLLLAFQASPENSTEDVNSEKELDDVDITITVLNNHIGVYTSFMTHVGPRIRNYFNSLKKLKSPTVDDFDTNNTYGIPERMDANQCASMIYNNADTSNLPRFINSIRNIGNTVTGFESFIQLANDLSTQLDFATEMLTVFQKAVISKFEVVENDGISTINISNKEANPRNVMIFDMLNDVRSTIEDFAYDYNERKVKSLINDIYSVKSVKDDNKVAYINRLQNNLIKIVKTYFPSIQENAILAYIRTNDNAGDNLNIQVANIANIAHRLEAVARDSHKVFNNYNKLKKEAADIAERNNKREEIRKSGSWIDLSEFESTRTVWANDYTTPINASVQQLINLLLPYSVINTSLNGRNIYGNNSSSVINVSWITRIQKMMEQNEVQDDGSIRNPALEKWGAEILKNNQHLYSSILVEHVDLENGLLNYGIFKIDNNNITVTPYANQLINCMMFSGSSFRDQGTNASYDDMVFGSYAASSFIAYHTTPSLPKNGIFPVKIAVATYFLPTPSDATNQFGVVMPKYSIHDLFVVTKEERERVENDIKSIISSEIPIVYSNHLTKYVKAEDQLDALSKIIDYHKIPDKELYEYLKPTHNLLISDKRTINYIDDKNAYVTFVTNSGVVLFLQGEVVKAGNGQALANGKLVGVFNSRIAKGIEDIPVSIEETYSTGLPSEITTYYSNLYRKELYRGDFTIGDKIYKRAQETINTDSNIYWVLRSHFRQEMIDAANAIHHYFELTPIRDENGKIIPNRFKVKLSYENSTLGKPIFKQGVSHNEGYKFYHLDENGEVLHEDNGNYSLNGKVFGSEKFTLVKDEVQKDGSIKKVPVNYLGQIIDKSSVAKHDGTINLLYGGDMAIECELDKDGNPIKVINVIFSEDQNKLIDEQLTNYIKDYTDKAIREITKVEDFIHNVVVDNDTIRDYAINQLIAHFNFDDLFIGSSKFYKNVQTILKRTKEYQGSGIPYGISDIGNLSDYSLDDVDNSYLNTGFISEPVMEEYIDKKGKKKTRQKVDENGKGLTTNIKIQDLFKGTILEGTTQRKSFRAVTIKNSIKTNKAAIEKLIDKLVNESGVSKDIAEDILYGKIEYNKDHSPKKDKDGNIVRKGGFTDTKVNDAQSYITIQEWVRRVFAKGQGQRYMPLIRKLIDPNYKLTAKDKEEFIQVQKNFYFDIHYDSKYGINVPRQIKNAEFVLVPQLIEGTQLEQVYELMREAEIDQLNTIETSKAANENVLTLWDNDGNITSERLENFVSEAKENAQLYSYNFLYTQQETPQHMNAENKAGIQLTKKVIDNLLNNPSLKSYKEEFFELFTTNIEDAFNKVIKDFNIPIDGNGNIKIDEFGNIDFDVENKTEFNKNFYNRLKEELLRTGIDTNIAKIVDIPENSTVPDMPCYINNYITKFESLVQSVFNNEITRQKLPGFHAPQITNVGWKSMDKDLAKLSESKLKSKSIYKRFEKWASDNNKEIKFSKGYLTEASKELFSKYIESTFPNQQYRKELQYHIKKDSEGNVDYVPYVEVIVPYSYLGINKKSSHYKNKTDEDILNELGYEGLTDIIGYRIPTEGKQSICHMKVVGFIDDTYGSTIIVPDDWVTQTGSDFDVDSVYAIQYESYKTRSGELKKINYNSSNSKSFTSYYDYIVNQNKKAKSLLYDLLIEEEQAIYKLLNDKSKDAIKTVNDKISDKIYELGLTDTEALSYRFNELYKFFNKAVKDYTDTYFVDYDGNLLYDDYVQLRDIFSDLSQYVDNYSYIGDNSEYSKLSNAINNHKEEIENFAKENNIISYKEYSKLPPAKRNSRQARNNRILEIFTSILDNPATLEETLYRSQFDDLVHDRNEVMNKNVITERENRNSHDVFDQMRFQEEAMSGTKLKAMSVSLDTFCSVCNSVRPELEDGILVIYEKDRFNKEELSNSFDVEPTSIDGIAVRHKSYGWSKTDKNVAGKYITAYSSQTTAFILDAIKEGSLPNVDTYSFSVFKTLPNLGCDFRTALSFIMSPGVSRIIEANNNNNSVFSTNLGNPIHDAIKSIAKQLHINVDKKTPVISILASINAKYGEQFNELFNTGLDPIKISLDINDAKDIPINVKQFVDRCKDQGEFDSSSPVEKKLLFDLGTVLIFNRIKYLSDQIGNVARCCNPDKFGAKQTVYATRKVFNKIDSILFQTEYKPKFDKDGNAEYERVRKEKEHPILSVDGVHILEKIYPGCTQSKSEYDYINYILTHDDRSKSSYHTLYSYLKYSSAFSTLVAKNILETENEKFVELIEGLSKVFSGYNVELDEETYNKFKKYVLGDMYNNVSSIKYGISINKKDDSLEFIINDGKDKDGNRNVDEDKLIFDEFSRIRGYGHRSTLQQVVTKQQTIFIDGEEIIQNVDELVPFSVVDINNPTPEEIKQFEKFSPAQKVKFIQSTFSEAGIFGLLNVNLFNGTARGKYSGMQTIEFKDENLSSNILYAEFRKAFYNTNPLVVSAAIDLVKYAVQVEGFNMSAKAINKVIDYGVLINEFGQLGLGFVDELKSMMNNFGSKDGLYSDKDKVERLYENFLRSNPDLKQIRTIYLTRKNSIKYGYTNNQYGCYIFEKENNNLSDKDDEQAFNSLLVDAGIKRPLTLSNDFVTNKYIRLKKDKEPVSKLYRIRDLGDTIILYPLSNLEMNENSNWSANEENNKGVMRKDVYEAIIKAYAFDRVTSDFTYDYVKGQIDKIKEKNPDFSPYYKKRKIDKFRRLADDFDINDCEPGSAMWEAKTKIEEAFSQRAEGDHYIVSGAFYQYIHANGKKYGSTQTIKTNNGKTYRVLIYRSTANGTPISDKNPEELAELQERKPEIVDIALKQNKEHGAVKIHDLYNVVLEEIKPNKSDNIAYASVGEEVDNSYETTTSPEFVNILSALHGNVINFMKNRQEDEGDLVAGSILYKLRTKGINASEGSIKENDISYTTREIADYSKSFANAIKNLFDAFDKDPDNDGMYLNMLHPSIIEKIKTDRVLRKKYQTACNMTQAFIDLFSPYVDLTATSDDAGIKTDLNTIAKNVEYIRKTIPLQEANRIYYNTVAKSMSSNPLIQDGLIDVLDGYWKTYGPMWKFNDIMETESPLMQIALRDIMSDIDKKKITGKFTKNEFIEAVNDIKKRAAAAGVTINMSHVVDSEGRTIRKYSSALIDKLDELRSARTKAITEHGFGSIEHLRAKLDYDEFLAVHFNQKAKREYYFEKCALTRQLLESFPQIFSAYETLNYKRRDLYNHEDSGFSDEDLQELDRLNQELKNITRDNYYYDGDGKLHKRPTVENEGYTITERDIDEGIEESEGYHHSSLYELGRYSQDAVEALNFYRSSMQELNEKYFKYESAFNFEQKLDEVLKTIRLYEQRDGNGIPTHPISELMKKRPYAEAVEWLNENAYYKETKGIDPNKPTTIYDKIQQAFKILGRSKNGKVNEVNVRCKEANNGKGIYDRHGIPDARLLSDEDIAKIKEAEEFNFQTRQQSSQSDKTLISNAPKDDNWYKREFYKRMKADATDEELEKAYTNTVKKINKILEKYVNPVDNLVHLENIPDTEEGRKELKLLGDLYDALRLIRPLVHEDSTNLQEVREFISKETIEETNTESYKNTLTVISNTKGTEFIELAKEVLYDKTVKKEDGIPYIAGFSSYIDKDGNNHFKPNRFLFTVIKAKDLKTYSDNERRDAIKLLENCYVKVNTMYYEMAAAEAHNNGNYKEWFYNNHVYNPETKQFEPLDCWRAYRLKDEIMEQGDIVGRWLPKGQQRESDVRDGKIKITVNGVTKEIDDPFGDGRNPDYKESEGIKGNYISGVDKKYDNPIAQNQFEKELSDLYTNTIMKFATVSKARQFFEKGFMPRLGKNTDSSSKTLLKESLKFFGITGANKDGEKRWRSVIGFTDDKIPDIPMTALLRTKQSYDYEAKNAQLRKDRKVAEESITDTEKLAEELKRIDSLIEENDKKIREIHNAQLNKDWTYVIGEFIEQMSRFNAIQENKQALYHLLNMLHNYKVYSTSKSSVGDLKENDNTSSKDNPVYEQSIDKNLIEQYENFIRRLLFDQWKEDSGMVKVANALQGFTSANYMMMNLKGGVANVTLGETGILAEAAAQEFFGKKDWAFGTGEWNKGVIGFCRRAYHDMIGEDVGYFNKQDAIVDVFAVVDYDERSGVVTETDLEKYTKKLRDVMFSPQNVGEHFMQNSVLFSMLHCHKLITMSDGNTTYMNEHDYIRYKEGEIIKSVLTDKQLVELDKFKKSIKANPNTLKDYAWFRKDVLSKFIRKLPKEQINDYRKKRKEAIIKYKKEFEQIPNMYDQIEVKNGKFHFVEGSTFDKLYRTPEFDGSNVNKAYALMGQFTERVRKVNNKIHGVYNKDGRAYIESKWFGSLVMQYHKHLPIGILKHYMRRGHWNEFRENVDKGMLQSVIDLHRLNIEGLRAEEGLTDDQVGALEGFKFLVTHILSYLGELKLTYDIMPEYDKANIRRRLGNYVGVAASMAAVAALWAASGVDADDDTPDSLMFNFWIYEFDRLASESFMYNPLGAMSEARKLMSSPIAAKSIIDDGFKSVSLLLDFMFDDEYDPYYHSGRFAGQHKLSVYIKRRIPVYSAFYNTIGLKSANHYYKYGENPIGLFNVKKAVLD